MTGLRARPDHRVVRAVDDVVERDADAVRPRLPGDERNVPARERAPDPGGPVVGPAVEVVADGELPAERRFQLRDVPVPTNAPSSAPCAGTSSAESSRRAGGSARAGSATATASAGAGHGPAPPPEPPRPPAPAVGSRAAAGAPPPPVPAPPVAPPLPAVAPPPSRRRPPIPPRLPAGVRTAVASRGIAARSGAAIRSGGPPVPAGPPPPAPGGRADDSAQDSASTASAMPASVEGAAARDHGVPSGSQL